MSESGKKPYEIPNNVAIVSIVGLYLMASPQWCYNDVTMILKWCMMLKTYKEDKVEE